nr:EamA family transporter [Microbacterium bovistercoris]
MEDKTRRWALITAIAPIAWGSTYFVTRQVLPDAALWGGVIRCLPAGLIVLLWVRRAPHGSWWWRSLVLGALTVGGLNVLVFVVAQRLPTSLAATLMSLSAAAMLLLSRLILDQRPRPAAVAGAVVGIVGVVIMMGWGAGPIDPWGVVASVTAMLSSSLGFILTVRWGPDVPPLTMTAWQLTAGSIVVLPFAVLVEGAPPALDVPALAGFAYVILVATVLAYAAWFTGLRHLTGGAVGVIGLLNPVTGVVLGVVLAGERFGPAQAVGLVLVITGVMLGARTPRTADRTGLRCWRNDRSRDTHPRRSPPPARAAAVRAPRHDPPR